MVASYNGNLELVKYLFEKGADTNKNSKYKFTPLYYAALGGHTDIVKYLHEKRPSFVRIRTKSNYQTPLHVAAMYGNVDVVRYLDQVALVSVNIKTKDGKTALYYAMENGHENVVQYLKANGGVLRPENAVFNNVENRGPSEQQNQQIATQNPTGI